jgi:hypothetical protein
MFCLIHFMLDSILRDTETSLKRYESRAHHGCVYLCKRHLIWNTLAEQ